MKKTAIVFILVFFFLFYSTASAQSTEFSYQGQLQNASALASGVYDFEFALFGSAFGGSQLGSTQTRSGVNVANGIFSVPLDFGNQFDGTSRFLEIRVRQSGGGAFTTLSPRQSIASSPYAVRSLDAQNAVNSQTAANAANATNAVNATTAINFTGPLAGDMTGTQGSTTVARLRGTNVAATAPTNGQVLKFNSGANQWQPDTDNTGSAGGGTITGVTAGTGLTGGGTTGSVTVGIANSGVGTTQLADGSVSNAKLFDGAVTDAKISSGQVVKSINSLRDNITLAAGPNISITPSGSTLTVASSSDVTSVTATAPLASSGGVTPNISVTGIISAANGGTGLSSVGPSGNFLRSNGAAWTSAPLQSTDLPSGSSNYIRNGLSGQIANFGIIGNGVIDGKVGLAGAISPLRTVQIGPRTDALFTIDPSDSASAAGYIRFGDGTGWQLHFGQNRLSAGGSLLTGTAGVIMTLQDNSPSGFSGGLAIFKGGVQIDSLFASGASPTPLCRNSLNLLSICSSSIRSKTDVKTFEGGLQIVNKLRPVNFTWIGDRKPDVGLIAEEVAQVEPLLAFKNKDGQIEGVNYFQLTAVLTQAVKEQQAQIEELRMGLDEKTSREKIQQAEINSLKKLVCTLKPEADICQ